MRAPLSPWQLGHNGADPPDDDNGDGSLAYPVSTSYQSGDLDLRSLVVKRDDEGFWFEAAFANPIRDPATAFLGAAADSVSSVARKGFYTFNIDIYLDTDRIDGSGNTFTLPGRRARIDPRYAWEKAVILTPRPELMRSELLDALARQFPGRQASEAQASLDNAIFLPTRVRIRGKNAAFFVPAQFFGSSAGTDWAMTAFVTGAKPYTSIGTGLLPSAQTPLEQLDMGVLQPMPGRPRDTFGYTTPVAPSPIVDLLSPAGPMQRVLLANEIPLTGVSWGPRAANDAEAVRLDQVPKQHYADGGQSSSGGPSFLSDPLGALKRIMGGNSMPVPQGQAANSASHLPILAYEARPACSRYCRHIRGDRRPASNRQPHRSDRRRLRCGKSCLSTAERLPGR